MDYVLLTSQLAVAGVFAASAVGKVRDRSGFAASLADFDVPVRLRRMVATAVAVAEVAVVPLALVPATAAVGLGSAGLLLCGFAFVVARALRRGGRPQCRCFGSAGAPLRGAHVVRNLILAVLAGVGVAVTVVMPDPMTITAGPVVVAGMLATVVVAVVVGFDDLLEVVSPSHTNA